MKDYLLTDDQMSIHTRELQTDENKTPLEMYVFSNALLQQQGTKKELGSKQQALVQNISVAKVQGYKIL